MKRCNKCGRELDESEFNKDSAAKDGLKTLCKSCCKAYKQAIREKTLAYSKEYNKRDYVKQQKQEYYNNNKNTISERDVKRKQEDLTYDINCKTIKSIGGVLAGRSRSSMYFDVLGYSTIQFKHHIETLFSENMTWDNYGTYWELDHIIPKSKFVFNSTRDLQYKICWSMLNLRPVEVDYNRQRPEDGSDISESLKYKIMHQFD